MIRRGTEAINGLPSATVGAAAGTGASASLATGSNSQTGQVTVTTGTTATTGTLVEIVFADPYPVGRGIRVQLTPEDADAAAEIAKWHVGAADKDGFAIEARAALTDATAYKFGYEVIEAT